MRTASMAAARGGLVAGSRSSALPLGRAEARWLRSQRKEWRDGRPAWFGVMESHGCSALRARNQGAFVWSMLAQARCVCVRPGPRVADGAAQSGPAAPAPSTGPRSGWATRGIRRTRRGQRRCCPPTPRAARGPALRRQRPHVFEWGDTHEPDAPCHVPVRKRFREKTNNQIYSKSNFFDRHQSETSRSGDFPGDRPVFFAHLGTLLGPVLAPPGASAGVQAPRTHGRGAAAGCASGAARAADHTRGVGNARGPRSCAMAARATKRPEPPSPAKSSISSAPSLPVSPMGRATRAVQRPRSAAPVRGPPLRLACGRRSCACLVAHACWPAVSPPPHPEPCRAFGAAAGSGTSGSV
jgi:hypothetical protein